MYRIGRDDIFCIRVTSLAFLTFCSYLPLFYLKWILCPLYKTLWNILMVLGKNVEQDEMTCRVQEHQLIVLALSPLVIFDRIMQ